MQSKNHSLVTISQISYDPEDPLFEEKLQELSDLVAAEES